MRYRRYGAANLPKDGGFLLLANHQTHMDPVLVGMANAERPTMGIARASLFDSKIVGFLLDSFGAIRLRRGEPDHKALAAAIKQMELGRPITLFPEGTRTFDGRVAPLHRGAMVLLRRCCVPVVPVAIEGFYDFWPRHRDFPSLKRCYGRVRIGKPIDAQTLIDMGSEQAMSYIRRLLEEMRLELRQEIRRISRGQFPLPGPADSPYWESEPDLQERCEEPAQNEASCPLGSTTD